MQVVVVKVSERLDSSAKYRYSAEIKRKLPYASTFLLYILSSAWGQQRGSKQGILCGWSEKHSLQARLQEVPASHSWTAHIPSCCECGRCQWLSLVPSFYPFCCSSCVGIKWNAEMKMQLCKAHPNKNPLSHLGSCIKVEILIHPKMLQPPWVRDVQNRQQKEAASKPAPVKAEVFPLSLNELNSQSINLFLSVLSHFIYNF